MKPLRIFFDTEFMEDGTTIDPLSLGFVTEDGQALYIEIRDADKSKANSFVKSEVLPYLTLAERDIETFTSHVEGRVKVIRCPREDAGLYLLAWVRDLWLPGQKIEFWAGWSSYDWVVVAQLYGAMIDLPQLFPNRVNDIVQLAEFRGYSKMSQLPDFPDDITKHNSLADAVHVRTIWKYLS